MPRGCCHGIRSEMKCGWWEVVLVLDGGDCHLVYAMTPTVAEEKEEKTDLKIERERRWPPFVIIHLENPLLTCNHFPSTISYLDFSVSIKTFDFIVEKTYFEKTVSMFSHVAKMMKVNWFHSYTTYNIYIYICAFQKKNVFFHKSQRFGFL